jgi:hypothetical protein
MKQKNIIKQIFILYPLILPFIFVLLIIAFTLLFPHSKWDNNVLYTTHLLKWPILIMFCELVILVPVYIGKLWRTNADTGTKIKYTLFTLLFPYAFVPIMHFFLLHKLDKES